LIFGKDRLIVMSQPFAEPCAVGLIEAEPCPRALGREIADPRKRMVLAACVLASSMAFIDGSALTVALPRLRAFFGADLAAVQWVLNGYVLALAALTLIGGALADVYGKARMLELGCLSFGAASAACIFAPSVEWLIAARVAQGVSAALLTPASLALIGATYPKEERNSAIGVWAAASALTTAGGPVLGGWLTQAFGWQYVFAINPPLALIALALLTAYAPADQHAHRRFDVAGAAILAAALAVLAWALSQIGPQQGSPANDVLIGAATAFGIAALGGYAWWERVSRHPMTPPWLLGNRTFVALNVATLLVYAGLAVMFFLLSFDLIDRRHLTPTDAGLAFLPFTLGVGLLSRSFGALADKIGTRLMLIVGPLGAALAYILLAFGKSAPLTLGVLVPMTLLGISFAVLVAPLTASVLSSVKYDDEGLASGVNNAVSRIAQLAGIALTAGLASYAIGYVASLIVAAVFSAAAAIAIAAMLPRSPKKDRRAS
jgi:EmrB/QacA subfamily drug resistance transporter